MASSLSHSAHLLEATLCQQPPCVLCLSKWALDAACCYGLRHRPLRQPVRQTRGQKGRAGKTHAAPEESREEQEKLPAPSRDGREGGQASQKGLVGVSRQVQGYLPWGQLFQSLDTQRLAPWQ